MNKLFKTLLAAAAAALLVLPVAAQDDGEDIIVDSSFGSSIVNSLNPLTYSSATDSTVIGSMMPLLFTANPETGLIEPGVPGTVAESWEISEDGTQITFQLRDDLVWGDGTPVTAQNWEFLWDGVQSGQVETRLVFYEPFLAELEADGDYTLVATLKDPNCESLSNVPQLPFPSHLFTSESGEVDWAAVNAELFLDPETYPYIGPYRLGALDNAQQVAMVPAGETWPAENNYAVNNDGYAIRLVGDQTILIEQFLAGDIDQIDFVPPDRREEIRNAEGIAVYEYPSDRWDYMAVNHANPENPQPAMDEEGNMIEFDPHPIFGDVRVRQALAHALNMDDVVEAALFGEGSAFATMYAPSTWVYPEEIEGYEYNPELALELLAEAGWVDDDNDPSTPLVATEDALYAEPGTPLSFSLITNEGNTRRTAFGQIAQDQLGEIGVEVDFQTIDFNTILETISAQTYDAVILGWVNGYPYSADVTQLFGTVSDTIGGDNFTSWHNEEFDNLMVQALTLPGCDPEERAELYAQAAQIFRDELPYIAQFGMGGFYAWQEDIQNVNPQPANFAYNLTEWTRAE